MLKTASIVKDESDSDEIGLNNTVEVMFEDDGTVETYRIVTSIRGNSMKNLISIESPIGKALLKHKVGDRVYVKVNEQVGYYLVVQKIEKTVDESEDEIKSF